MTGSPPPTTTSYQLVPGFSSCHLVFSYQAPHSVYLNFNLISLTERQGIQIPSLLPGTSFEMGLKRSIREDGCVCLLVGVGGRLSCGWSFFSFLKILVNGLSWPLLLSPACHLAARETSWGGAEAGGGMSIFNALGEGTSFSVTPGMGQRGVSGERTQPPFSVPL